MFEAWTLHQDAVTAADEQLREAVSKLDDARRADYFKAYNQRLKDPDTYAVLNWFFLAGLHHFYLGKHLRGAVNLLIMAIGIAFLFIQPVIGWVVIVGIIIIELPALFRSQIIVADYNVRIGRQILYTVNRTLLPTDSN